MKNEQQIVLVSRDIDYDLLKVFLKHFSSKILIVTPKGPFIKNDDFEIVSDDVFFDRGLFLERCKHPRPGWLYQQFLKYQIVLNSEYENTLIIDGDSLIVNKIFLTPNKLFFTPKRIEDNYNKFISRMLGPDFVTGRNYITNQMNFNKETLESMLNISFGSIYGFPECVLDILEKDEGCEFSEYQTYAAWALKNCCSEIEKIKVFRRHDLINENPLKSLKKYDLVAFEPNHKTGLIRTARAKLFYMLGLNLG